MAQAGRAQDKNQYRWVILVAMCAIVFMTMGTRSTLGVFFKAIVEDLGWNRGTISMVVAVNIWLGGLAQPFAGYVMDRFGAKWLFTASVAVFGLGFGLLSLTNSLAYLLAVYGIVLALAMAGSAISLTNVLVAQWFPAHRRGLAIGINNASTAVGQLCLVWISAQMLQVAGWRTSQIYLGLAVMLIAVPMALLIPRQRKQDVDDHRAPGAVRLHSGPLESNRWSDALHTVPLWQINAGYFVCGMTVSLYFTHLIPFATDRGFSTASAATAFGILSICSAIGALLSGALSDRLGRKNVLALAYLVRAMAFAVLLYWRHELALHLFAFLAGISWLATPGSVTALTSEVYGMRTLGTLAGVSLLVHQLGGGASVWLAGVLYDTTGSYDVSFQLGALALIAASVVSWMIAERRYSVRYLVPSASAD
ncbi:MAG TPA: MFS transporter [Candidatus Entotheonella sp.]